MRFPFAFGSVYRAVGLLFGVAPGTAWVEVAVAEDELRARFGPWRIVTPLANVAGTEATGPYTVLKTIGPAHVSLSDRGLTFSTNDRKGLCIRFGEPVAGIEPTGRLRHPALTVTVADVDGLAAALDGTRPAPA